MTRAPRNNRGFTLIELLVVVAIIALLVSILLPSLARARDQSQRALCASQMHQQALGFSAYSAEHKQVLPIRGAFSYNIREPANWLWPGASKTERPVVSVGSLYGKYSGKDLHFFYCPADINTTYEKWYQTFMAGTATTPGSYAYAVPVPPSWYPRDDGKGWLSPPKEETNCVRDPRTTKNGNWWGDNMSDTKGDPYMGTRSYSTSIRNMKTVNRINPFYGKVQALVTDYIIGATTSTPSHKIGYNVMFQDYHAKFVVDSPDPTALFDGKTSTKGVVQSLGGSSGKGGSSPLCKSWNVLSRKH